MKKILFSFILLLALASTARAQISVGVGYLNSKLKDSEVNDGDLSVRFNGFYIGADYNIKLGRQIGIAPGLYYSRVSTREAKLLPGLPYTGSWSENFIDIPIHFNAMFDLGLVDLGVYAGPTLNFDVGDFIRATDGSHSGRLDMVKEGYISMFDLQLGLGAIINLGPVSLRAGYNWGVLKKSAAKFDPVIFRRNQLNVGIAYVFDDFD